MLTLIREVNVTSQEESAVGRLWSTWSVGKTINNQLCTDFFFEVIRRHATYQHLNAFEVLDVVVNVKEPSSQHG